MKAKTKDSLTKRSLKYSTQLFLFLGAAFFVLIFARPAAQAQVLITPEDALHEMWPNSTINKKSILLTPVEAELAQVHSHIQFTDRVFTFYSVELENKVVGYGGIYTSKVRTKDETSLFMFDTQGLLKGITVIAFYEPIEYAPSKGWLSQYKGKTVKDELQIRRDVPVITGATLTSTAVAHAARLMLRVWEIKFGTSATAKDLIQKEGIDPEVTNILPVSQKAMQKANGKSKKVRK